MRKTPGRYTNADLQVYQNLHLQMKIEDFTLKHLLLFEICEICEKLVYKHLETIEYVKN